MSRVWPLRVIKIQSEKNAPKLKVINTVFSERGHRRNYMFNLLQTLRNNCQGSKIYIDCNSNISNGKDFVSSDSVCNHTGTVISGRLPAGNLLILH